MESREKELETRFKRFLAEAKPEALNEEAIDFANHFGVSASEWGAAYAWYLLQSQPPAPSNPESAATEGVVEQLAEQIQQAESTWMLSGASKLGDKHLFIASRLSESRPVVSREAIGRAFETANPDALEKEEYDFSAGFDAIHALQLPAPSAPSSSDLEETVNIEDFRRAEFETWAVDRMLVITKHQSGAHINYDSDLTDTAWNAWRDSAYALAKLGAR